MIRSRTSLAWRRPSRCTVSAVPTAGEPASCRALLASCGGSAHSRTTLLGRRTAQAPAHPYMQPAWRCSSAVGGAAVCCVHRTHHARKRCMHTLHVAWRLLTCSPHLRLLSGVVQLLGWRSNRLARGLGLCRSFWVARRLRLRWIGCSGPIACWQRAGCSWPPQADRAWTQWLWMALRRRQQSARS